MAKTQEEIIQDKQLLADFVSSCSNCITYHYTSSDSDFHTLIKDTKFNSFWDWLMPVILKIDKDLKWSLIMSPGYLYFTQDGTEPEDFFEGSGYSGGVSEVFDYVVEFFKWYNKSK